MDEPRAEKEIKLQSELFDTSGRQKAGWVNKLIWGDNKLILSSLKNGPLREAINREGGIKLIYIDPPFSAGIDYSISVEIGDGGKEQDKFVKEPSVLEEFAYRNTWGNGGNSFLSMLYERIILMRDILAEDGIFFLRIDHHWGHYVKTMLDEIFIKENFQGDIVVNRIKKNVTNQGKLSMPVATDSFFVYFKSNDSRFEHINFLLDEERKGYWRRTDDSAGERRPRERYLFDKIFTPPAGKHFKFSQKRMEEMISTGKLRYNESVGRLEYWVEPSTIKILDTNWTDVAGYSFTTGYPTENAEILLERVIDISTKPGDLIADFFSGSGTTIAVAERLGRKWIASDLGKFSIHTIRKRMIGVQRALKKAGKDYRAFEILNLGKYERQHYIGINPNLRDEEKQRQIVEREQHFLELILSAYKAEPVTGFKTFHGKKAARMVAVGPVNLPVSRLLVQEVLDECLEKQITKVDVLGFEFEMGLFPNIQEEAKEKGIDLALKYIPRDVFDKRAIEKNQVVFHDVAYIEVKPHVKKNKVAIELIDFSVFYNQDAIKQVEESLKNGGKKIVVENGQIIKLAKDKDGIVTREQLTQTWVDWIDYWSVDFNFESKQELVRVRNNEGKIEEHWTGDYIFENEWQSFRTKKDRSLELVTAAKEMPRGRHKIAIKVVDIFGNDTMKVIEISI